MCPRSDASQPRVSRRRVLQAAGVGVTAVLGGSMLAGARQIDTAPPVVPATTGAARPETIPEAAARLGFDRDAIFAFVRDEIHYESYAGVLRGATGTLRARAGNSADQAVLLAELLAASQLPYRYAVGPLAPDQVATLTNHLARTSGESFRPYGDAMTAALEQANTGGTQGDVPELNAEEQALFDRLTLSCEQAFARVKTSTGIAHSAIMDALALANVTIPQPPVPSLTGWERSRHAWIQVPDGPDWIALDPSLGHPDSGTPAREPVETLDVLPADWQHTVTVTIAADDLQGGAMRRRDVVSFESTSDRLVEIPIALSMVAGDAVANFGLTMNELFSGQVNVLPLIYADGASIYATQPLRFAAEGSTILNLLGENEPVVGAADGETIAVWLIVESTGPDTEPIRVERALLDRVPEADRHSGAIDPEAILPISLVATETDGEHVAGLDGLILIHVDVARIPVFGAGMRASTDAVFGELGLLGPSLASFRDSLGLQDEQAAGYWSYPSAPNITAFTITGSPSSDGAGLVSADLFSRQRTSLPLTDVDHSESIHPRVLSGIVDAAAEQILLEPATRGDTSGVATSPSIGRLFELAIEGNVPILALTSPTDLERLDGDVPGIGFIASALDAGAIVVIPERPIEVDDATSFGWWIINPSTGATRDQMANGKSFAAAGLPGTNTRVYANESGERVSLQSILNAIHKHQKLIGCIGNNIGVVAVCAATLVAIAAGDTIGSTIAFTGYVGQGLRAVSSCAGVG